VPKKQKPKEQVQYLPEGLRVLVKVLDSEKVSKGGIIIPDVARDPNRQMVQIVAIDPDVGTWFGPDKFVKTKLEAGHFVLIVKNRGVGLTDDTDSIRVIDYGDIMSRVV